MFIHQVDEEIDLAIVTASHAHAMFHLMASSRDELRRWLGWAGSGTVDEYREFVTRSAKRFAMGLGFYAGIRYQTRWAGAIDLVIDDHNQMGAVGFWLGEPFQGQGIMTRTLAAVTHLAFDEYQLNRLELRVAVGNTRSMALAERSGFRQEGVLRQREWLNDRFSDVVVFGLLAQEWNRNARSSD